MYDNLPVPGRNDACWCGSGKKYKKCHAEIDQRLDRLYNEGFEVPVRSLLKTPADIEGIQRSAAINIGVLDYVAAHIAPGVTTAEVDKWIYDYTVEHGGIPADLNYEGFPNSVCTSINEQVCHGIPSPEDILCEGDIVNVDCSTILDGYYSDSSRMFIIGETTPEKQKLVEVTRQCVQAGLEEVKPWEPIGNVGEAVHSLARKNGYTVVREVGGHGVGVEFHEDPFVSYVTRRGTGMIMAPGMIFTIEPMVNMGTNRIYIDADNDWTIYTQDGKPSAQWEIQVLVTETGHEVLAW